MIRQGVDAKSGVCLLGVGVNAEATATAAESLLGLAPGALCEPEISVFWMECPDLLSQLSPQPVIPAHWRQVDVPPAGAACVFFQPGLRLFPSFWGPILGALRAGALKKRNSARTSVILPGGDSSLLTAELAAAFAAHGLAPLLVAPERLGAELPTLPDHSPALLFSVNGRGLDGFGETFHTLRALGIPTHIWFVDNPWHVLSAFRAPWWKAARLWVTDHSFIEPLRGAGAEHVAHLPLAAWPERFANPVPYQSTTKASIPLAPVVFVGRSAFPDKAAYFAGQKIPTPLFGQAIQRLGTDQPPDFFWWANALGVREFWPGRAARGAGLGAEECGRQWRAACLRACHDTVGLTVFGDNGWRNLLPEGADIRPPVDYYATLPGLYAAARYSLNVTSLLLPAGLTQRHFDTWTAGGFCLTNATPGLSIFPDELTRPIAFTRPEEVAALVRCFENDPSRRAWLIRDWQAEIAAKHTYAHRVARILATER